LYLYIKFLVLGNIAHFDFQKYAFSLVWQNKNGIFSEFYYFFSFVE